MANPYGMPEYRNDVYESDFPIPRYGWNQGKGSSGISNPMNIDQQQNPNSLMDMKFGEDPESAAKFDQMIKGASYSELQRLKEALKAMQSKKDFAAKGGAGGAGGPPELPGYRDVSRDNSLATLLSNLGDMRARRGQAPGPQSLMGR